MFERTGSVDATSRNVSRVEIRTLDHQGELYILGLILDYLLVSGGNSSTDHYTPGRGKIVPRNVI